MKIKWELRRAHYTHLNVIISVHHEMILPIGASFDYFVGLFCFSLLHWLIIQCRNIKCFKKYFAGNLWNPTTNVLFSFIFNLPAILIDIRCLVMLHHRCIDKLGRIRSCRCSKVMVLDVLVQVEEYKSYGLLVVELVDELVEVVVVEYAQRSKFQSQRYIPATKEKKRTTKKVEKR